MFKISVTDVVLYLNYFLVCSGKTFAGFPIQYLSE